MVDVENKKTYVAYSGGHKYHRVCAAEDVVFVYNFEEPFEVRLCAPSWACVLDSKSYSM